MSLKLNYPALKEMMSAPTAKTGEMRKINLNREAMEPGFFADILDLRFILC